jgi:hypothetical protein
VGEIVSALFWFERIEDLADCVPECIPCPRGGFAEKSLELGERHFDGIEIRRIGRQVEKNGACGFYQGLDAGDFVSRQIVDHDDVARREGGDKYLIDIDQEGFAVHRPIQNPGCDQSIASQAGRECRGLPMPPRRAADQSSAAPAAAMGSNHLGRGPGLVDKHQALDVEAWLDGLPAFARLGYVRPLLLGGVQSFF